ncbi:MAG: tRNA guanosine(34) transglycosylase Tgt [Polyangiaceae bacterium]|nr:tRNA guanosine(34) transglycosylase Tgt [Polyangiaceae bacterium]
MKKRLTYTLQKSDGNARRATLELASGTVQLPTFMPVGTQGNVKTLTPNEIESTGAEIVLGNTYHLMLRPGAERVARFGGLARFSKWPKCTLTDSGGFQAFSLSSLTKRTEEGFSFRSHIDGSKYFLSPEEAVRIQGLIGADIQMQLDDCPPGDSERKRVEEAVQRTTRWAKRAVASPRADHQCLFGIVQGSGFVDLRRAHADELGAIEGLDGLALGGFSVGEPIPVMYETLAQVAPHVDPRRPRYLMGVGTPQDLLEGIEHGIDMFDCVLPTRNARNGQALTRFGKVVIKQARYQDDEKPIDPDCSCLACKEGFSRAYLRHLYLVGEILPLRLFSIHNLHFYGELMQGARSAIERGEYLKYKADCLERMTRGDA